MLMKILSSIKDYYTGYQNKDPTFEDFKELYRTKPATPNALISNTYEIWCKDWNGDIFFGESYGKNFQEACDYFFLIKNKDNREHQRNYNSENLSYWGGQLYEKLKQRAINNGKKS